LLRCPLPVRNSARKMLLLLSAPGPARRGGREPSPASKLSAIRPSRRKSPHSSPPQWSRRELLRKNHAPALRHGRIVCSIHPIGRPERGAGRGRIGEQPHNDQPENNNARITFPPSVLSKPIFVNWHIIRVATRRSCSLVHLRTAPRRPRRPAVGPRPSSTHDQSAIRTSRYITVHHFPNRFRSKHLSQSVVARIVAIPGVPFQFWSVGHRKRTKR
jgi:hypothetical protein